MHAWLAATLPALVLLHVVAAFAFALVHGPSVFALWAMRGERDPARLGALLDLSRASSGATWIATSVLALTGALLAWAQHAWGEPWAWGSAVVLVTVSVSMSLLGAQPFNHARGALGLPWFDGKRTRAATGVIDAAALDQALGMVRARAAAVTFVGVAGLAVLVWLMVEQPG